MNDLTKETLFNLITRLNQIEVELQKLGLKYSSILTEMNTEKQKLDNEYNEIIYELWNRIPSLKDDVNIQPKKKVKERKK